MAIAWAREHEPPLAIRAGGHLAPGFCTCEDGIVIDVRELGQADVDPQGAIRCGSGLTWREFDAVTQQYGLERAMGLTSDRLGGGHGW